MIQFPSQLQNVSEISPSTEVKKHLDTEMFKNLQNDPKA